MPSTFREKKGDYLLSSKGGAANSSTKRKKKIEEGRKEDPRPFGEGSP